MGNTDNPDENEVGQDDESCAARLARILQGDVPRIETIGILTAANPLESTTPKHDNKRLNRSLYQDLLTYGIRQMRGQYGRMDNPYLVANMSRERVVELGSRYSQESVIVGRCNRAGDCVMFELVSTSDDQTSQGPVGTVISTRRTFLQRLHGTSRPDDKSPAFLEHENRKHIADWNVHDGENDQGERDNRQFVIPFFDDGPLKSVYRGSRVLNYYRHEIPRTRPCAPESVFPI